MFPSSSLTLRNLGLTLQAVGDGDAGFRIATEALRREHIDRHTRYTKTGAMSMTRKRGISRHLSSPEYPESSKILISSTKDKPDLNQNQNQNQNDNDNDNNSIMMFDAEKEGKEEGKEEGKGGGKEEGKEEGKGGGKRGRGGGGEVITIIRVSFFCYEYGNSWWPNWGPSSLRAADLEKTSTPEETEASYGGRKPGHGKGHKAIKGLGGSEEAVIYLSRALAALYPYSPRSKGGVLAPEIRPLSVRGPSPTSPTGQTDTHTDTQTDTYTDTDTHTDTTMQAHLRSARSGPVQYYVEVFAEPRESDLGWDSEGVRWRRYQEECTALHFNALYSVVL